MSNPAAKRRLWTLTSGKAGFTCRKCGAKHRGSEVVIVAVGDMPRDLERVLVEEKESNYVEQP
jgi:tRNA(Ile2) C34 agmatinyltransferase TiaS